MPSLGWNFTPSRPNLIDDRAAYFAEYRAQLEAAKAPEVEEVEVEEVIVTEEIAAVGLTELPAAAKALALAAAALGWGPQAWRSCTRTPPTLFKTMSESHNIGDVRFVGKEWRHYFIGAKHPGGRLGFTAVYTGKGLVGASGSFMDAHIYDPYGLPVDLFALHQHPRYNDGGQATMFSRYTKTVADLTGWLDEWLEMKAPSHKKLSRMAKVKDAQPVDLGVDLITIGEWSSE